MEPQLTRRTLAVPAVASLLAIAGCRDPPTGGNETTPTAATVNVAPIPDTETDAATSPVPDGTEGGTRAPMEQAGTHGGTSTWPSAERTVRELVGGFGGAR